MSTGEHQPRRPRRLIVRAGETQPPPLPGERRRADPDEISDVFGVALGRLQEYRHRQVQVAWSSLTDPQNPEMRRRLEELSRGNPSPELVRRELQRYGISRVCETEVILTATLPAGEALVLQDLVSLRGRRVVLIDESSILTD